MYNVQHLSQGLQNLETQTSFSSSPLVLEHSLSAAPGQGISLSVPWMVGPLLASEGPKKLSRAAGVTLPVHSSLPSLQRTVKHSEDTSGILRQHQHSESTLWPLQYVGEDMQSSLSTTMALEALKIPPVPRGHSTSTKGAAESFGSIPGNVVPIRCVQVPLKLSMSAQKRLQTLHSAEQVLQSSGLFMAGTKSPSTGGIS